MHSDSEQTQIEILPPTGLKDALESGDVSKRKYNLAKTGVASLARGLDPANFGAADLRALQLTLVAEAAEGGDLEVAEKALRQMQQGVKQESSAGAALGQALIHALQRGANE